MPAFFWFHSFIVARRCSSFSLPFLLFLSLCLCFSSFEKEGKRFLYRETQGWEWNHLLQREDPGRGKGPGCLYPGGMMGRAVADFCRAAWLVRKKSRGKGRQWESKVNENENRTNEPRTRNIPPIARAIIIERNVSMMNGNSKGVSIIVCMHCVFLERVSSRYSLFVQHNDNFARDF